jgi:NACHT domain
MTSPQNGRAGTRTQRPSPGFAGVLGPSRRRGEHSGADDPPKWRSPLIRNVTLVTLAVDVLGVGWLAWFIYLLVRGKSSGLDNRCAALSFSCGLATNLFASAAILAVASSFLLWRLRRLQLRYQRKARKEARELVPTAGAIIDRVIGRDELCKVVMADLHEQGTRPQLLVGGVGTGKTAVLVKLTEMLAERNAIPVPVRLRDAATELDFETLARDRFLNEVNRDVFSAAEGETIWRRLRKDRKIVVLADGLEEALAGPGAEPERDNLIRAAIKKAHQRDLPLIIASRPHAPLQATEAAMLKLEPLSYEAALEYIAGDLRGEDERRLAWIVEVAEVVEAPLYLQITRDLHVKGLLEPTSAGQFDVLDTRSGDRSKLRLGLLETWARALVYGHLREDIPLNRAQRHAALEHMSALACVGLMSDQLEVGFNDAKNKYLTAEVQRRLAEIDQQAGGPPGTLKVDVRLAAAWAAQLDLVELRGESVRFPHSLMQAYLGSRLLDAALLDSAYGRKAMKLPKPGREFLIALVLHSRAQDPLGNRQPGPVDDAAAARPASRGAARQPAAGANPDAKPDFVRLLREAAGARDDNKVFDIYAAALEIDSARAVPEHTDIAREITKRWSRIYAQDSATLEESKIGLVRRFGEAARAIGEQRQTDWHCAGPAYAQLYAIGCTEQSYPVQLAAAQEIGAGGDSAYAALQHCLAAPCDSCHQARASRPAVGAKAAPRPGDAAPDLGGQAPGPGDHDGMLRARIMSAWVAPMLAGSVSTPASRKLVSHARDDLTQWLRHITQGGEEDLPISLEIALAQGFKYAANRRPGHSDPHREARMYLAEHALEMLKSARYWFSQLTLIQALGLLNLPEGEKQPGRSSGGKPDAIVWHWFEVAGRERRNQGAPAAPAGSHPFVREAAELVIEALKTGRPQRYCWIDESGVIGQVGSRRLSRGSPRRRHRLWIPPSAGWTALDGRAQRLVADVLLLLNLADRGEQASERDRRLERSRRHDLPPCITTHRSVLDPGRTVGTALSSAPGTNCLDDCVFELCPYPPKGGQPRGEMSEAFCRRQQRLLRPGPGERGKRKAPWQQMRAAELSEFWADMASRARGPGPRPAAADRGDRRVGSR